MALVMMVMMVMTSVVVNETGVRHVPYGDSLASSDDHVVDSENRLRIDSHPGHLFNAAAYYTQIDGTLLNRGRPD